MDVDVAPLIDFESSDETSDAESVISTHSNHPKETQNSSAFSDYVQTQVIQQLQNDQLPSQSSGVVPQESLMGKVRDYQQELFDRAKEKNIIAVLDTGSGKTLIAALLIKHFLELELMNHVEGEAHRIVFFLANSVHLAQQQAHFLTNNLPNPVISLYGDSGEDLWKGAPWAKIFRENHVVVCTPEVLRNCLDHAYYDMDQISLLIFDEAHHCKGGHPYARIIEGHYMTARGRKPHIFGMTASPVDGKGDVGKAFQNLEYMLQSHIVTTDNLSMTKYAPRAKDDVWVYPAIQFQGETGPGESSETDLCRSLRERCGFVDDFKQYFVFSVYAKRDLGHWAADRVWKQVFTSAHESHQDFKAIMYLERTKLYIHSGTEEKARLLRSVQSAVSLVRHHNFKKPNVASEFDLSPKVRVLYEKLKYQYSIAPATKTIVFVQQKLSVTTLCACFQLLEVENMRPGFLTGTDNARSLRDQQRIMAKFRDGQINIVFATEVVEEGIDIPQCNLVVRFDLYQTTIQYMQSRGRARATDSIYAHMVEENNSNRMDHVRKTIEDEKYIRKYCQHLSPDRKLGIGTHLKQQLARAEKRNKGFITSSGMVANLGNSLELLKRYAESLRRIGATSAEVYVEMIDIDVMDKRFTYKVILPSTDNDMAMRVRGAVGEPQASKVLARCSAAWKCCVWLRHEQLLDENLDSIFQKVKPDNLNARIAVSEQKDDYKKKLKPDFWLQTGTTSTVPMEVFATFVDVYLPTDRLESSGFILFTRAILPVIPEFPVFLQDNVEYRVGFESLTQPIAISAAEVESLTKFTLNAVFEDIFRKVYEPDPRMMSYWLAPASRNSNHPRAASKSKEATFDSLVDAEELRKGHQLARERWMHPNHALQGDNWMNKYLVDPGNGSFHYFTKRVVRGVSIWDPALPIPAFVKKRHKDSIIEFTDSTWRRKNGEIKSFAERYDSEQPVLEATLVVSGRNWLEKVSEDQTRMALCYIAPQPLEIGRISAENARTLQLWPAVLHKLENFLIVSEALLKLKLTQIPLDLGLQAFTQDTKGEADGDRDAPDDDVVDLDDSIDAHRRVSSNYERLEFIGDSLLKMMTTITIYNRTTCNEEGMHCKRMEMLSNSRLFSVASKPEYELFQYIRASSSEKWRDTWYPDFLKQIKGRVINLTNKQRSHALGKKTIADVCEAVIGAAIMTTQHLPTAEKFDLGIQAITKLVEDENHDLTTWKEVAPMYQAPGWSLVAKDPVAHDLAEKIFTITGYRFRHPRLLRSAFTHSSDQHSTVPDLQRLEFLGDACLDWVCIWWLFSNNETRGPQWLTEHKMAMVSNKFLAALAVTLGFNKLISAATPSLFSEIAAYATWFDEASKVDGVKPDFWTKTPRSPPKALADLVESYLGAVLVDSGFDFCEIEKFFNNHVVEFFRDIRAYDSFANRHPTTFLFRLLKEQFRCQKSSPEVITKLTTPSTRDRLDTDEAGDEAVAGIEMHVGWVVHGKIIEPISKGSSIRYARTRASNSALKVLVNLTTEEFREKYKCDCVQKQQKKGVGKQQAGSVEITENGPNTTGSLLQEL
ncbi:hypothetical protein LTR84_011279 [Exophiala bonariae]|uniref:Dicer-like protein 1 n=1 Tax=Exophiala bonariae TaxID=1690606 RepID=A0AAV9MUW8_9EURO|nr:hypothetical protein LTR84_011279 [Exophiala bonariae]